jgi:hypothetical protein
MSYDDAHTIDDCDKCLKRVGKRNLIAVGFLYLDRNDDMHEDYDPDRKNYKQYCVCKECWSKGV